MVVAGDGPARGHAGLGTPSQIVQGGRCQAVGEDLMRADGPDMADGRVVLDPRDRGGILRVLGWGAQVCELHLSTAGAAEDDVVVLEPDRTEPAGVWPTEDFLGRAQVGPSDGDVPGVDGGKGVMTRRGRQIVDCVSQLIYHGRSIVNRVCSPFKRATSHAQGGVIFDSLHQVVPSPYIQSGPPKG